MARDTGYGVGTKGTGVSIKAPVKTPNWLNNMAGGGGNAPAKRTKAPEETRFAQQQLEQMQRSTQKSWLENLAAQIGQRLQGIGTPSSLGGTYMPITYPSMVPPGQPADLGKGQRASEGRTMGPGQTPAGMNWMTNMPALTSTFLGGGGTKARTGERGVVNIGDIMGAGTDQGYQDYMDAMRTGRENRSVMGVPVGPEWRDESIRGIADQIRAILSMGDNEIGKGGGNSWWNYRRGGGGGGGGYSGYNYIPDWYYRLFNLNVNRG